MVDRVVSGLDPSVDILAGADLPFMHMGRVAERLQLRGDPHRSVAVAAGIADEDVGHGDMIGSSEGELKPRVLPRLQPQLARRLVICDRKLWELEMSAELSEDPILQRIRTDYLPCVEPIVAIGVLDFLGNDSH
jgi:hypothetical protein